MTVFPSPLKNQVLALVESSRYTSDTGINLRPKRGMKARLVVFDQGKTFDTLSNDFMLKVLQANILGYYFRT